MQRVLVILLAAFDAVIATATGVAVALAPLTLVWVFALGTPVWSALWPAAAAVWQLGHFVPLAISLPADYLAAAGIGTDAAAFTLSLAPLAFAAFTAVFAARSGARAARAGAWVSGTATGTITVAVLAAGIALTARTDVAAVALWQAVLFPALVYAVPALAGAIVAAWREGDGGAIDALRDRIDAAPRGWSEVPGLVARGAGIVVAGLVALGALAVTVGLVVRGGQVIALFEAGHLDALGSTVVTLGQLAYLPTLVVWGLSFVAGPGFAFGSGSTVSAAGTQLGIVPGIPVLGILPESTSPWLLVVVLLPVLVAAFAGWAVRVRLATAPGADRDAERPAVLAVTAAATAVLAAAVAALACALARGAIGPGVLADVGPDPGPVALAVGVETLVGAGIVLLTVRRTPASAAARVLDRVRATPAPTGRLGFPSYGLDAAAARAADFGGAWPEHDGDPDAATDRGDEPGAEPDPRDSPAPGHASEPDPAQPGRSPAPEPDADPAPEPDADPAPEQPRREPPPDPGTLGPGRPAPLPPLD